MIFIIDLLLFLNIDLVLREWIFFREGAVDAIAFAFLVATALDKSAAISSALDGLLTIFYQDFLLFLIQI